MKKIFTHSLVSICALLLVFVVSCEDYSDLDPQPVDSGEADFSTYVSVGNSLTAGYQSSSLYESAQKFSYPNQLARQFQQVQNFTQPLISDPGIGGRIELTSLNPLGTKKNENQGSPINQDKKPFQNLGIPGAVLVDYANPNNSGQLKERATNPSNPAFNPFYSIVMEQSELAKDAPNVHDEVAKQNPTFITFWLGNNDVLNFVTSGGQGQPITPPSQFSQLYQASAQLLASTGADVMVYTIPDITTIPFVFQTRAQLEQQGTIKFDQTTQSYQLATPQGDFTIYIDVDGTPQPLRKDDFLLLTAQSYFASVQAGNTPPPIKPQTAIPDKFVLDGNLTTPSVDSELEQALSATQQYNASIKSTASATGFAVVDINQIFSQIVANFQKNGGSGGYDANGLTLEPTVGSLFTFDGIHPTNRGAAVIANESIKLINNSYGASIPTIDVSDIPQGLPASSGSPNQ